MGILKPKVKTKQPKSQATPLAENLLELFQGILGGEDFGAGIGTQQRAAGENISQYISARQSPDQFMQLMGPLREAFGIETDRAAAQQRESLGGLGARFSTSLAREEGRLRGERATELDALMSQLFLGEQGNLLNAIAAQQQFGTQAIEPIIGTAQMGILPEQAYIQDSAWNRYMGALKDVLQIGKGIASMGKGAGASGYGASSWPSGGV